MSVAIYIQCPRCNETNPVICNGHTTQGKQRYRCDPKKDGCGKSFLQDYSNKGCLPEIKNKVIDMVLNSSGISDISRVLEISKTTVIETIKAKAVNIRKINFDKVIDLSKITMLELSVELDEQWSWVQNKANQRWLWAALDSQSGEIVAFVFGKRTDNAFKELKKLLKHYKIKHYSSDGWGSYMRFLEEKLHTVSKALTTKIERKFLTLRTRIKRLCRKTICFSKSELMHDTVIGLFINKYEFGMEI